VALGAAQNLTGISDSKTDWTPRLRFQQQNCQQMADHCRAIQYATTIDGMQIAYSTIGSGLPLIFLPQVWQNLQRLSAQSYFGPTFSHWARRFRVVLYDSRGQGLSQRGLPNDHTLECYDRHLETVIDAVGAERVILFSSHQFSRTAVRYASHYPNRVAALVAHFYTAGGPNVMFSHEMLELARTNWDGYIHLVVNVAVRTCCFDMWITFLPIRLAPMSAATHYGQR
jgi:hypothetical protein